MCFVGGQNLRVTDIEQFSSGKMKYISHLKSTQAGHVARTLAKLVPIHSHKY